MKVQLEKDLSMAFVEGLPLFSKNNIGARLRFAKLQLNEPQDF